MKSSTFELGLTKKKIVGATFLLFTMFWYRALYFSPTWPAAMQIETKENFNPKKKIQLPQDWFVTPAWPPFYRVGKSIWRTDVMQIVVL